MMNAIQTIVAVGKAHGDGREGDDDRAERRADQRDEVEEATTKPSASAYGTPRIERTIQVAIGGRTLMTMLPSVYSATASLMSTISCR